MDFLYQYDPVRDTSPVRVLSGGGDFGGTLSRYDINNAYRDVLSSGYEGSVSDFTRLLSNTRDGKVSYWIDVENTRSYEQIKYYNSIFPEFLALGIIPELIKARKKITVDIGNTSEGWGNKSDPLLTINFNRGILQIETNFSKKDWGAITPSPFVVYPKGGSKDKFYNTHEPGHVIQFLILGPITYYRLVAIPSLITSTNPYHKYMPWEMTANQLWYWLTGENYYKHPLYFGPNKK